MLITMINIMLILMIMISSRPHIVPYSKYESLPPVNNPPINTSTTTSLSAGENPHYQFRRGNKFPHCND